MQLIEKERLPAPAPIEQRWTSGSSSAMSPASSSSSSKDASSQDDVTSWVGIIMYLPTDDAQQRQDITAAFKRYTSLVEQQLMAKYNAVWHWAKLELPDSKERLEKVRQQLRARYPVDDFNAARAQLDPNNLLSNEWLDALFGPPAHKQQQQ